MDKIRVASELVKIARDLTSMEFDSPEAMKRYLKEHPDADKSKHTVKKQEQGKKETESTGVHPHQQVADKVSQAFKFSGKPKIEEKFGEKHITYSEPMKGVSKSVIQISDNGDESIVAIGIYPEKGPMFYEESNHKDIAMATKRAISKVKSTLKEKPYRDLLKRAELVMARELTAAETLSYKVTIMIGEIEEERTPRGRLVEAKASLVIVDNGMKRVGYAFTNSPRYGVIGTVFDGVSGHGGGPGMSKAIAKAFRNQAKKQGLI